ncbi:Clavaminate synthase-like protein [Sphaerulina musiva SO2202]|uniref:Clavaminate synthase-like protein n=1 Tax=Sphaerulina musiva (strain SO2202) TaxID=692275 RepID=N1QMD7_SPHMS|nr:Clavaminate synthase-like protein [Sphaerulina musiva SO2202]EMF16564.1 Clavaminate synthase-like protein [Sphaerulina musiva SO2202]
MPHKEQQHVEFVPEDYPPFPADLKTIDLQTISLQKIQNADSAEQDRMFAACKNWGFFYLDLTQSDQGELISQGAAQVARVAEGVMALPLEEKEQYPFTDGNIFGYKKVGQTKVDKDQTPDTAEFFNVSKNDMIVPDAQMKRKWPNIIVENKGLLSTYCKTAHSVGVQILGILASKLGIDPEEIFQRHTIEKFSGDHIRMTRGPPRKTAEMPEIQTPSHTDFGTITILMNWLGGLQVLGSPNRILGNLDFADDNNNGEWLWVKPKKNCAIVNLGDAAVKFTNGVLCSGRHRVIPAPGSQGQWPRYSIVYFVRPIDECKLKTLKGTGVPEAGDEDEDGINAREWIFTQAEKLAGR